MKASSALSAACLLATVGCVSQDLGPGTSTPAIAEEQCSTAFQYSGRRLEWSGVNIPIEGGANPKTIVLASGAWGDVAIQEAHAIAQALDVMQYGDCVLLRGVDDGTPLANSIVSRRAEALNAIANIFDKFDAASTEEEVDNAVGQAQQELESVIAIELPSTDDETEE